MTVGLQVVLLGTGSDNGWPDPLCGCAACATLLAQRMVRAPSSALVDGCLLLDVSGSTLTAAAAAGRPLTGVRHVLLTAASPDRAALLPRLRPGGDMPEVIGPPAAVAGVDGPVTSVSPGDRLRLAGYDVAVLAGSRASVCYQVRTPCGALLWAPQGVAQPTAGPPLDLALLGGLSGRGADGAEALAGLRSSGRLTPQTDVVAVGLPHDAAAPGELARALEPWGARAVTDGTPLVVPATAAPRRPSPARRTLVLGGARSGKSATAERLLAAAPQVTYVATGGARDGDEEWARRVAVHRERRPAAWRTVETADVARALREARAPVLVDCLALWLTSVLDEAGAWDGDPAALIRTRERMDELVGAWRACAVPVVAVSNEVGSGVVPATASGRLFRDELGRLNTMVADESELVLLVVAGQSLVLRGRQ